MTRNDYDIIPLPPIGIDSCCYSNYDLERREVRINMGYFPGGRKFIEPDVLKICRKKKMKS